MLSFDSSRTTNGPHTLDQVEKLEESTVFRVKEWMGWKSQHHLHTAKRGCQARVGRSVLSSGIDVTAVYRYVKLTRPTEAISSSLRGRDIRPVPCLRPHL
jgi:hypothetical protein